MRADFLTVTSMDPVLFGEADTLLDGDIWRRSLFGAEGRWDEHGLFVGRFPDGRFIASCSGPRSHDLLLLLSQADFDASVARLDLQTTLVVPAADDVVRGVTPHPRYRSLLMAPVGSSESGATLYVGAPRSRKRLRLYNKSAQSGVRPSIGEYIRVELQLRDGEADYFYGLWRAGGEATTYKAFRSVVVVMAPQLESLLPLATGAHIDVSVPPKVSNYVYWFEHSVFPAIQRAMYSGEERILDVLREMKEMLSSL